METDQSADAVQPDTGQGDEATAGEPPYAEYLSRIPEEARGVAEEAFKEFDANTTRKFQEHSEYRKNWEPYEQIGVNQVDPGVLQDLLNFNQAVQSNPQAIQQWFEGYAKEHGLTAQQAADQLQAGDGVQNLDELAQYDPQAQALKQMLESSLQPLQQGLQEIASWRQQQEQAAVARQAEQLVDQQIADLKAKHGAEFDQELVEMFVPRHMSDPRNAVGLAFADAQKFRAQIEKQTLQSKLNAPAGAEAGGAADAAPEEIKTLDQASAMVKERMRAMREQNA